jgi:hypothetical protein
VGNVAIWIGFAVDYLVRLALAPSKVRFVRGHVLDLVVLALPLLAHCGRCEPPRPWRGSGERR